MMLHLNLYNQGTYEGISSFSSYTCSETCLIYTSKGTKNQLVYVHDVYTGTECRVYLHYTAVCTKPGTVKSLIQASVNRHTV